MAYEPGLVGETVEEAIADIDASWNGDYGKFWEEGSVIAEEDGRIVGALLTVKQAPWDQTPDGPFIIELFVDSELRGRVSRDDSWNEVSTPWRTKERGLLGFVSLPTTREPRTFIGPSGSSTGLQPTQGTEITTTDFAR